MDFSKIKNLGRKTRVCEITYPVAVVCALLSWAAGGICKLSDMMVPGYILLGAAILLALIGGTAQVLWSCLAAEELYRITGRRPKKNKR